jgi:release factor glutamine methyltransferase
VNNRVPANGGQGQEQNWTVLSMLEWATAYFEDKGVSHPRLSIEWLLSDLLGVKRLDLYLQFDRPLTKEQLGTLREWVRRRAQKEPLQYITGSTDFYRCKIFVDKRVLIPRPETEELVDIILADHDNTPRTLVDFGTGSGCIAIAIKKERPSWYVIGVDIDGDALQLARKNAEINATEIEWIEGDMRSAESLLHGRPVDIVVSNPPYILPGESESMDDEVKNFEPSVALFHHDPVALYMSLMKFVASQPSHAALYCETHFDFGTTLLDALKFPGWLVTITQDYNGKDRFLKAILGASKS